MEWPNHASPWREWREAMTGARMHHGWILAGKSGLGKLEFAFAAARELVAEHGVGAPAEHPDIISVTYSAKDEKEEKKQADGKDFELSRVIRERDIGRMQRKLQTRPTMSSRRVVIVFPADDMNTHAANKLLKSLEEPPKGTFFILVSHRPARLLPTIRSRCRVLRFPLLTDDQLRQMLAKNDAVPDNASREAAMKAASGSYGAALGFIEQNLGPVAALIARLLQEEDLAFSGRGDLARAIGPRADRERLQAVMELAQSMVAEAARQAQSSEHRARLIDAHAALVRLAGQAPTYNFDTGLLTLEIGTLLVGASAASDRADV
ncbi:DNA polymerase III subunit delta' [Erythrobacter sp. JK5]|uniref:DNA polymerase III subunit delta' n=1 Tax=Erythrobacter sp. JK5 TaxID=2829500 RepID=UPI001BAAB632|nr:DNA polymerase III subunit delta' [Erythrobacter sp. JK5]QUL38700.1 DNA polymerase III subunit delta' [Erythrobacter sp. JK5]